MSMGYNRGEASCSYSSSLPSTFPYGLRILVVDDDPTCLMIVEKMLKKCKYEVTSCDHPAIALSILREKRGGYDLVLTDVYMPDINGFELLEIIAFEMDLPVIMMSANCDVSVAMKGLEHGACYYIMKPVSMGEVKNLWQHIIRKHREDKGTEEMGTLGEIKQMGSSSEDSGYKNAAASRGSSGDQYLSKQQRRNKCAFGVKIDAKGRKKTKRRRVIWNTKLHQKFLNAIDQIGIDSAVPKKILEIMDVPGVTRENIASHLQKYRLFLRRLNFETQSGCPRPLPLKLKQAMLPLYSMVGGQYPSGIPSFPQAYNQMGAQPTAGGDMQNTNASMSMTTAGPAQFIFQNSQSNDPFAPSGFGQSNLPLNEQPILHPGSSSSALRAPLSQQNGGNMGFGMVPQHMEIGSFSIAGTTPMTQWPTQPTPPGVLESAPLGNFGMQNAQTSNNITNMGNVEMMNRFNQFSFSNSTSNNTALQLTSSGGFYGMNQTGAFREGSSNMNSGNCFMNDISNKGTVPLEQEMNNKGKKPIDYSRDKGKMPLEMEEEEAVFLPELTSPEFSLGPYVRFDNSNQYPTGYHVTQEVDDPVRRDNSSHDIDNLLELLRSITFGNSSDVQSFYGNAANEVVANEAQDGMNCMETYFDFNPFRMNDKDRAQ